MAVAVKVRRASSARIWLPMAPRTGATLTSLTVTVIRCRRVGVVKLSQTCTVKGSCRDPGLRWASR